MSIDHFRYFAGWADKITGKTIPVNPKLGGPMFGYTLREPMGVVGQVSLVQKHILADSCASCMSCCAWVAAFTDAFRCTSCIGWRIDSAAECFAPCSRYNLAVQDLGMLGALSDVTCVASEALSLLGYLQITPFNFPLLMAAWKSAPALAAGCCVVLKVPNLLPALSLSSPYHAVLLPGASSPAVQQLTIGAPAACAMLAMALDTRFVKDMLMAMPMPMRRWQSRHP